MCVDWHQAHWLELARQSSQVRRLRVKAGPGHRSPHPHARPPLPVLAGLTGYRVEGIPLDSSEHLDRGLAGCMLHPLCGWCSDATHRRGPGGGQGQNSAIICPESSGHSLLPLVHLQPSSATAYLAFTSPLWITALLSGVGRQVDLRGEKGNLSH